jgi:DNA-binding CsgD family transcriptional regulator
MAPSENFPTGFQQEGLATINRLVPLSFSIFALVDPSIRSKGMVLENMDIETDREYQSLYSRYDPLHPDHFRDSRETVVCLDDLLTKEELFQSVFYREFMRPHQIRYVADKFLRREEEIIAFLSLMRDETMEPFSTAELELLKNLQPLLEFSLNNIYKPQRVNERSILADMFQLTSRELDVIEHIIAGSSNKSIAEKMYLSLSTIKTHLQHIFENTAVNSRTKLLAKIYQAMK